MKRTDEPNTDGFVLLEVLPAVLVFSAFFVLGIQLCWTGLRLDEGSTRIATEDVALIHVWETWERTGGTVAIAVRDRDVGWQVYDFPDESWLPAHEESARWMQGREWRIFRRRQSESNAAEPCWEIEVKNSGEDPDTLWKWKCRVRMPLFAGPGELEVLH